MCVLPKTNLSKDGELGFKMEVWRVLLCRGRDDGCVTNVMAKSTHFASLYLQPWEVCLAASVTVCVMATQRRKNGNLFSGLGSSRSDL